MPPLPKRKVSKGRRNRRRSHHAIRAPQLVECPQCHSKHVSHRACPECGTYRGRTVIEIEDES